MQCWQLSLSINARLRTVPLVHCSVDNNSFQSMQCGQQSLSINAVLTTVPLVHCSVNNSLFPSMQCWQQSLSINAVLTTIPFNQCSVDNSPFRALQCWQQSLSCTAVCTLYLLLSLPVFGVDWSCPCHRIRTRISPIILPRLLLLSNRVLWETKMPSPSNSEMILRRFFTCLTLVCIVGQLIDWLVRVLLSCPSDTIINTTIRLTL